MANKEKNTGEIFEHYFLSRPLNVIFVTSLLLATIYRDNHHLSILFAIPSAILLMYYLIGIVHILLHSTRGYVRAENIENSNRDWTQKKTVKNQRRNKALAGLIALVIKADDATQPKDIETVCAYLNNHYSTVDYNEIVSALKINLRIKNKNFVKQACSWLLSYMNYSDRFALAEFLFDIARQTKQINKAEWKLLYDVMNRLEISEEDSNYLSRKYSAFYSHKTSSSTSVSTTVAAEKSDFAYGLLGLQPSATRDEVQSAYRKLAKKYHPDTVQDADMKKVLTEKFKEISAAYTELMR